MENERKFLIKFSGTKQELHAKLKSWCALSKKGMNETIVELIENFLKENS